MITRNQKYAAEIFGQVNALPIEDHKKYGSMAHKLPVLIRTAGLVQALEFVNSRGDTAQQKLLAHLAAVLGRGSERVLLEDSRKAGIADYMHLTHNALAALIWYKRFAQSVLKVVAGDEENDEITETEE